MNTVKTAPNKAKQNGTAKKETVQKTSTKIDDILNPTADSRMKKLENFNILAEKHKFLTQKNDDLQKFIVSSDGMKEKIVLKNAQGFTFEASNSQVIEKVIYVIKEELQKITDHSEKQVLEFSI